MTANKNPRFTGVLEADDGLEPTTFCMANEAWELLGERRNPHG
jgi:hypothetical protein